MSNDYEKGGLPAAPDAHLPSANPYHSPGFTLNLAGVPIPMRRTFAAIDRLFAIPIEALGDAWERKIKGNLDSHVEKVQKSRKKRGKKEKIDEPSLKITRVVADWASNATDVQPDDKDMSALWEALLDAIMDDENEGEQLLKIVSEAQRSDIRFFLWRFGDSSDPMPGTRIGHMDRLMYIGLLEPKVPLNVIILMSVVCVAALYYIVRRASTMIVGGLTPLEEAWSTLSDAAPLIGMTVALGLFFIYQMKRPTPLGERLLELFREYRGEDANVPTVRRILRKIVRKVI